MSGLATRIDAWVSERLLERERPLVVPAVRILLGIYLVFMRLPAEGARFAWFGPRRPRGLLHAPLLDALDVPWPPSPTWNAIIPTLLIVLAVLATLGIATRLSLAALFVLWLYVGQVLAGWGFFNHTPALAAQVILALVVLPGTTAYSVDRLIVARLRRGTFRAPDVIAPLVPRFGAVVLFVVIGSVYLASGVAKLRYGGLSWIDGTTLQWYLRGQSHQLWWGPVHVDEAMRFKDGFGIYGYTYLGGQAWARFFGEVPLVPAFMANATVVLEVGAPFFLVAGPRARGAFCLSAITFHILVAMMIGPGFDLWIVILVVIFPWPELIAALKARRQRV